MKAKLILIGGGGHCAACIDVIEQEDNFEIAGIVDKESASGMLLGYPVLCGDDGLSVLRSSYDHVIITVGQIKSPSTRIRLFEYCKLLGFIQPTIISPRAYVSKNALIGEGTIIMHDALINSRVTIGSNCIINTKALLEHDVTVEDHCHISTGAILNGRVNLGAGSFVGSGSVIKDGISIGKGCVVGMGLSVRSNQLGNVQFVGKNVDK